MSTLPTSSTYYRPELKASSDDRTMVPGEREARILARGGTPASGTPSVSRVVLKVRRQQRNS
eukprot:535708-Alexandrium_andersonii.AAC.1